MNFIVVTNSNSDDVLVALAQIVSAVEQGGNALITLTDGSQVEASMDLAGLVTAITNAGGQSFKA